MTDRSLIKKPLITEKSHALSGLGKYVFEVKPEANKNEVRKALKSLYGVDAVSVRIINIAKRRRFMRKTSVRRRQKKAIVTLKAGQTLDVIPK